MPRQDLSVRLASCRSRGKGASLTAAEVIELTDSIATMALIIQTLNTQSLRISVDAEAIAHTILDCLCLEEGLAVQVQHNGNGWSIFFVESAPGQGVLDSFLTALDYRRNLCRKEPISGITIEIDGTQLYSQLVAAISQQQAEQQQIGDK